MLKNKQGIISFKLISMIFVLILLVTGLVLYFNRNNVLLKNTFVNNIIGNSDKCTIEENRGDIVPIDIARKIATKQVNQTYQPFVWVWVGDYTIYRSSGDINYYGFVFRKSDFKEFTKLEDIEKNANKFSGYEIVVDGNKNDNKYQLSNFATVITGSSYGDSLIIRHYLGLPKFSLKKTEVLSFLKNNYSDKTIGNIIMDSPMGQMYYEIVNKNNTKSTGDVIDLDLVVSSVNNLTDAQEAIDSRKSKSYATLNTNDCNRYKKALEDRYSELKDKWSE